MNKGVFCFALELRQGRTAVCEGAGVCGLARDEHPCLAVITSAVMCLSVQLADCSACVMFANRAVRYTQHAARAGRQLSCHGGVSRRRLQEGAVGRTGRENRGKG
jgi:hypothetical protein